MTKNQSQKGDAMDYPAFMPAGLRYRYCPMCTTELKGRVAVFREGEFPQISPNRTGSQLALATYIKSKKLSR